VGEVRSCLDVERQEAHAGRPTFTPPKISAIFY
jgi:hypothetical protein